MAPTTRTSKRTAAPASFKTKKHETSEPEDRSSESVCEDSDDWQPPAKTRKKRRRRRKDSDDSSSSSDDDSEPVASPAKKIHLAKPKTPKKKPQQYLKVDSHRLSSDSDDEERDIKASKNGTHRVPHKKSVLNSEAKHLQPAGKPSKKLLKPEAASKTSKAEDVSSDSESDDWEAVEDAPDDGSDNEASSSGLANGQAVEITIDVPNGKKKDVDIQKYLLSQLRKKEKEFRTDLHQIHLMCCLAHGFYLNDVIGRNQFLLATALSYWDPGVIKPKSLIDLDAVKVKNLVSFIKKLFPLKYADGETENTVAGVYQSMRWKSAPTYLHLCMIMLLMLRSLGIEVRLVYNMQPVPVKEPKLAKVAGRTPRTASAAKGKDKKSPYFEKALKEAGIGSDKKKTPKRKKPESSDSEKSEEEDTKKTSSKKKAARKRKARSSDEESAKKKPPAKKLKANGSSDKKKSSEQKPIEIQASTSKEPPDDLKTPKKSPKKSPTKVPAAKTFGVDYWIEIYSAKAKAYLPVHCITGEVGNCHEIEKSASQPVHYVVAFNGIKEAKEVTALYAAEYLTVNRKLQDDPVWWKGILERFKPNDILKDAEEDAYVMHILMKRPRPKSVQEYKGHPLYVLAKHLLKYEALYPPNLKEVDEIKGEKVYLRSNVYLLHTRENWLKEAKIVKEGEKAYKLVKRVRPKKASRRHNEEILSQLMKDSGQQQMSELFGEWQTKDYDPPVAVDGKVPRNEYGNVDFFKPQMLPKGCVHIPIKNLHKVAKKLGIDCAAAMTGWDFSGGHCHPVMDGWIVCKEFEETLMDAWNTEQETIEQEEKEKRQKKIWNNWHKILKKMLWKSKIQLKYKIENGNKNDGASTSKVKDVIDVDSD